MTINWNVGDERGLISVGKHHLSLYAYGPDRTPGKPVALVIPGLGGTVNGWSAARRMLSPLIRTYLYDRSGYGKSELSIEKPNSSTIVAEMDALLRNADINPPYVLIAHSWGGILAREFISLRPDSVSGLVLIDANQEHTLEILDWSNPVLWSVAKGLDDREATGLTQEHKLTPEEWQAFVEERDSPKYKAQLAAEFEQYRPSFPQLGSKHQLHRNPPLMGNNPVVVVKGYCKRDFERRYAAGVKAGNGTEEERVEFLRILETFEEKDLALQQEPLTLSSTGKLFHTSNSGHSVHMTEPEAIVEGVEWVLQQIGASHDIVTYETI